jgi:hypothetical protein
MWKPEHRRAADRRGLRYPNDLSDAEWAMVAPMIPPAKRGGRRREVNCQRRIKDASAGRSKNASEWVTERAPAGALSGGHFQAGLVSVD